MKIKVQHFFDAMHQLSDSEHLVTKQCHQYHGHTYKVIVEFEGENNKNGMIIDFKFIKNLIDEFDHTAILKFDNLLIKEIERLIPTQKVVKLYDEPTAENIAKAIAFSIWSRVESIDDLRVSICEGYKGEERASWVTYDFRKSDNFK